ncbi:vegetative incompatibility protein HET-E-1 [Colletotrichum spaethianum]|uniref:Vegetative incompatibility protein HET-E-1 n=1 Tax=Colletotrichum spaethianum TaxID=700344 RepID=A0AA37L5T8_9PEZI|nr:vegetative incompatibility protein HET-E-1 [Colletotrichum spaethianum]GKT42418.1 vegetative incompatibility protein HET-E-1 [Colletotrichum spaethianum]
MFDPLSVAGSAVGIISLGLQVTQSLYNYYAALSSQNSDIAHTTHKLENLLEMLNSLQAHLDSRKIKVGEANMLNTIKSTIQQCGECIQELDEESQKFKKMPVDSVRTAIRVTSRRLAYPFRQSTLQKLDEDIDELVTHLSLALQLLQQEDIDHVQNEIENTRAVLDLVRASQISSQIQDWLKAPDASIDFNDACSKKHPGTGLWFVKSSSFTTWLELPRSFLWLKGFAGCGKSVLCSTAIQHTFRHRRSNPQIGIAFFFFTFNDGNKQNTSAMLRALVMQLSSQLGGKHTALTRLYESYRNTTPPDQALLECLHQLVRAFRDVYIVIDALDESARDENRDAMLQSLNDIRGWSESGLHLLVTSRDEVDIRDALEAAPEEAVVMRNDGIDEDIAKFVSQHLRENRRLRKWQEYHGRIEQVLIEKAKGV